MPSNQESAEDNLVGRSQTDVLREFTFEGEKSVQGVEYTDNWVGINSEGYFISPNIGRYNAQQQLDSRASELHWKKIRKVLEQGNSLKPVYVSDQVADRLIDGDYGAGHLYLETDLQNSHSVTIRREDELYNLSSDYSEVLTDHFQSQLEENNFILPGFRPEKMDHPHGTINATIIANPENNITGSNIEEYWKPKEQIENEKPVLNSPDYDMVRYRESGIPVEDAPSTLATSIEGTEKVAEGWNGQGHSVFNVQDFLKKDQETEN